METAKTSGQRIIVRIGAVDVDFTDVPPITGGDRKALFNAGVDLRKFTRDEGLNPVEEGKLLLHLVQKVCPAATEADVDAIPSHIQNSMMVHFLTSSSKVTNPFVSPSSTSSPASTAGDQKS